MPEWNPRANDVFLRAFEIEPAAKRREFLDVECAGDAALRQQVEALLAASEKVGSFLNQPAVRVHEAVVPRRGVELSITQEPVASSVLARIAESVGGVPHVLLRDTEIETGPGPIVMPSSSEMPEPAQRPDKYQLLGEIARGGMGAILRGRDVDLGRDLAVKVLLEAHKEKPNLVKRFVEEAQIGGQLQHPGVVPVYELGSFADRRPFFTMKLVKGRTLAELLLARSSPAEDLPRFLSIFESVAQTMAYAHVRGVIHRDLKPSNVMVGSFGEVQVMDWGLAKVLPQGGVAADEAGKTPEPEVPVSMIRTARSGSDADASQAGSVLGTPGYMAPEQARGELEAVDERADVFGLGAILCEILTGKPAFTGRSAAETLRKAGRGEVGEAFGRLDGCGAEPDLIALARKCLAPEREDRPRQAGIVAEQITAHLAGVQERLRQTELARVDATARAQEERKRRKLTLGLAAAVLALVTVGGGGAAMYLQQRRDRASRLELALREVNLLRSQAEADPEGDPVKWRSAVEAVKRAEVLLGPLSDREAQQRVRELGEQVAAATTAAERDATLIREAVDIRSAEADDPDGSASDAAYARVFRDARLDIDALGPEAAALKIKARPAGVALALAAALDDWAAQRRKARPKDADGWKRLLATVRAVDPEPTRDRMRQLWSASDRKAQRQPLLQLAREADPRGWPPVNLTLLAGALAEAGERDAAADLLRRAQTEHPGDVWVNYNLARLLEQLHPPRIEEAIRFYSAARAVRPETAHELAHALKGLGRGNEALAVFRKLTELRSGNGRHWGCLCVLLSERGDRAAAESALQKAVTIQREAIRLRPDDASAHNTLGLVLCDVAHDYPAAEAAFRESIRLQPDHAVAHHNLGLALRGQGKMAEAIAEYREAIRRQPDSVKTHHNLGNALHDQGKVSEAIAEYREAIRLKPDYAEAHTNLGYTLSGQGKVDEAIAEYRQAIRLKPDLVIAHTNLGRALHDQGKVAEAIAEYREAIRLQPDYSPAHYHLGLMLSDQGKVAEAIAAYREAIRLKPDYAEAHCNLGFLLRDQGQFREALDQLRRGHEVGSKRPGWPYPSAEWLRQAERMVVLENRLPAVLRGEDKPKDAREGIDFASLASKMKRFGPSARLYAESFGCDTKSSMWLC
jgi:serine/threonine-protein kinase